MADLDYGTIKVYGGNYDDFMEASTVARERQVSANTKPRNASRPAGLRAPLLANKSKARRHQPPQADRKDPAGRYQPSSRQYPWIRFDYDEKESCIAWLRNREPRFRLRAQVPVIKSLSMSIERRQGRHHRRERVGKTTLLRLLPAKSWAD